MKIFVSYCVPLLLTMAAVGSASAAAAAELEQPSAVIAAVILGDVTAFSSEELLPAYAESLGRPRTSAEEQALQRRVRSFYTGAGFLQPAVVMQADEQTGSTSNIITLRVIEPRVVEVGTAGLSPSQTSYIQRQIQALQSLQPVSAHDIDSFRADAQATLDIQLDTRLTPLPDSPSGYRLDVAPRPKVSGELIYTAEGSQSLGRHMAGATLVVANPLPQLSELYFTALHTIETDGYGNFGAGTTVPVSDTGRFQFDFSKARAVPQYEFARKGTRYRRHWSRLQYVHDFRTTREKEIDLYLALSMRDYEREEFGLVSLDEQLRLVDVGMRSISGTAALAFRTDVNLRLGLDEFGARRRDIFSDETLDLSFQLVNIDYTIWQSLPAGFSLKLDVSGQFSPQELPYSQRFSMGGGTFFHAYEAGEFSGDSGIGTRIEVRRGIDTELAHVGRLVPYVYYGIASARENIRDTSESAAGAGAGLRLLSDDFSAFLEFGKPLTQRSEYKGMDTRATGRITYYF
ncbi:ShlB/FhaC/HecB family hemolysin secretion/activation protein [Allohahella marinimesophila]|uniref:Haemolysin activator HlyB C-terminal domain-containing protein n=1 Tax=Allohahella marinimesophila TaxID=1054972 RepID=A0ABP7PMW5_9GAMM